jgi:hypothetical protein
MSQPKYYGSDQWKRDIAAAQGAAAADKAEGAAGKALQEVRRIHSPRHFSQSGEQWDTCVECCQAWPCATERAIAEALGNPS